MIKCCICGRVVSLNRETDLCYRFSLQREFINNNGCYCEENDSEVFVCKSCFSRNNNESIMRAIWKEHEHSKKVRAKNNR